MMKKLFVLCINDGGYPESLEKRKFYELLEDLDVANEGMLRIIDESGEDYLYSENFFVNTTLPQLLEQALETA